MRFDGTLISWNDDRGFGRIQPTQGGELIPVNYTAWVNRASLRRRPRLGDRVSFEVTMGGQGKRATQVASEAVASASLVSARHLALKRHGLPPDATALWMLTGFLLAQLMVAVLWRPSAAVLIWQVGMSLTAFVAYGVDKSAALRGGPRIRESTLHTLGLLGGWPGALVAQGVWRHKTSKVSFRRVFKLTILLHVLAWLWVVSPAGQARMGL